MGFRRTCSPFWEPPRPLRRPLLSLALRKNQSRNQRIQIPLDAKPVQHMAAKHMATTGTESEARFDATGRNSSNQHTVLARTSTPRTPGPRPSGESLSRFRIGSWLPSWWPKRNFRTVTGRTPAPRRSLVFVRLAPALSLLAVLGVFLLHDGAGQPSGVNQTGPMPEVSLGSPIANVVQSPQPKSTSLLAPQLPIAKSENFPGAQTRALADNIRSSRASTRGATSARSGTSEKKFPKEKLLPPHSHPNHSPEVGREAAPDLSRADSNTGVSPLQGVLATLQPHGGRAKEAELLSSSPPIYPALAKQARIEGQVTIDAVIDTSGEADRYDGSLGSAAAATSGDRFAAYVEISAWLPQRKTRSNQNVDHRQFPSALENAHRIPSCTLSECTGRKCANSFPSREKLHSISAAKITKGLRTRPIKRRS